MTTPALSFSDIPASVATTLEKFTSDSMFSNPTGKFVKIHRPHDITTITPGHTKMENENMRFVVFKVLGLSKSSPTF
jgi:hypothetical protein